MNYLLIWKICRGILGSCCFCCWLSVHIDVCSILRISSYHLLLAEREFTWIGFLFVTRKKRRAVPYFINRNKIYASVSSGNYTLSTKITFFMECLWFIDPLFGSLLAPTSYDFIKKGKVACCCLKCCGLSLSRLTLCNEITQSVLLPFFTPVMSFCVCV